MTRVLVVSPHLDDAVFSAGGTLARLTAAGARVTVATVFTATVPDPQGFALACQLDKGLGPEVDYMALRRHEDRVACATLRADARHLPFREAPHRGYASAPELFASPREDDGVCEEITPALRTLLQELELTLVLAPQAVGAHVDHVAVVRALRELGVARPTAWWRDHPYAIRTSEPLEPFSDLFAALQPAEAALGSDARAAKVGAALAYGSQLGFQFGGPEIARQAFTRAEPVERFRTEAGGAAALQALLGD